MSDWYELPLEQLQYWVAEAETFQTELNKETERRQKEAERKAKKK